ncbi:MAG: DUF805 domain-containing protein [Formivibrio sp.]|nr:DUF805 domain-containing protein [Formivibrio sp.]
MEKTVRLVFQGGLLPGRSLEEVKAGLPSLLRVPPEHVDKLFAGGSVVIKRGLPASKLDAYQALLQKAGIQVLVEEEVLEHVLDIEPMAQPVSADVPLAPAETAIPAAEEMLCPQCGVRQPRRTLCRACGVDMPRYAAAQTALKADAGRPVAMQSAYAATTAWVPDEELPPILSFSFDGRLNRMRYTIYGLAGYVLIMLVGLMVMSSVFSSMGHGGFPLFSILLFGVSVLALLFFGLRFSVQRLHDIGLTGWLVLLSFAPFIGGLVWIWLSVWPGNKEANQYGPPNPPNSLTHKMIVLGLVLLLVLLLGVAFKQAVGSMMQFGNGAPQRVENVQTPRLQL